MKPGGLIPPDLLICKKEEFYLFNKFKELTLMCQSDEFVKYYFICDLVKNTSLRKVPKVTIYICTFHSSFSSAVC